ncbi:MAG: sugar transferase [Planctomycetota bacterium]
MGDNKVDGEKDLTLAADWRGLSATILMVVVDVALYNLGVVLAFYLRFQGIPPDYNFDSYRNITTFVVIIPYVSFLFSGVYAIRWANAREEDFLVVFRGCFVAMFLLLTASYVLREDDTGPFPTSVIFLSFITTSALLAGWRYALKRTRDVETLAKGEPVRVALLGTTGVDADILARIERSEIPRRRIIGYSGPRRDDIPGLVWLGPVENLGGILAAQNVGGVFVSSRDFRPEEILQIVRVCEHAQVPYAVLPGLYDMITSRASVDLVNYVPVLRFGRPVIGGWHSVAKRMMDVSAAAAGLVLFSPLFCFISAAIMLDSRGWPFFGQMRVGKHGRRFIMRKFRTMIPGAQEQGPPLTRPDDARVTRVGRWLRRLSLDELPQLYNVLVGDMSLVGPRAVIPYVADRFDEWEKMTLNILPGITGLAQVSGRDELGFRDKAMLNIYYIRNYSFILDLAILFKTIHVVISQEGTDGTRTDK